MKKLTDALLTGAVLLRVTTRPLLQLLSLAVIAYGVGMIYLPAGVITAGLIGLNYSVGGSR